MARLIKILLGAWLVGILGAGQAPAAVSDLGILSGGNAKNLFGMLPLGLTSTDTYEFDISGAPTNTIGVSAISLLNSPALPADTFDLTIELREWNGTSFGTVPGAVGTGVALLLSADVASGLGSDHNNEFNRHFELTITGTPTGPGIATYGGSLSVVAVPEASVSWLVICGLVFVASLRTRQRERG